MSRRIPRRQVFASVALVVALGFGGCLTLGPTVTADTGNSAVFEQVSSDEPWASGRVKASVNLTQDATTDQGVTKLVVVTESGSSFDTTTVETGQTSGISLYFPANGNATVTAVNTVNGTVVGTQPVTTSGNKLF
ncbi:hypothetical protein [Halococcus saccharolyticus]|uniref:Uncharacterized protein n=1 Tax=Halococcus saccharolyticus DSM 5350 TaxID=1227455 RepID=M0MHY5_9EURY|nr:hypothetical protein [Halococcus saccharolyticus]EMA44953.1 hypothetical protein C449_09859 [Halococcus saccharolyticus DSM 5350]